MPPGTPTNGAPPLRWDPRWFPRSSRRGNGVNFEAAEAHALMEHLGHAAAVVDSEEDAEAFVGALIPLAARLLPRAAPALLRNAPVLIRAAATATRALRGNARTRPLVRAMPAVVRRTAVSLARRTPGGRPVTPDRAARTLAAEAVGLLRRPPRCLDVLRRASRADRRYHQARREGAGLR